MKRKILFGSLLSVFILLLLPSAPAVEFNVALDSNESSIDEVIKQINMNIKDLKERLKEKIKNIDFKWLKENINDIEIQNIIDEINGEITNKKVEPNCIITLSILKLILRILGFIINIGSWIILSIINILALIILIIVIALNLIIWIIIIALQGTLLALIELIDSILQKISQILFPNRIAVASY